MKEYLVDYEELAKFVDALITQKYPGTPVEAHKDLREKTINELDESIGTAIFNSLSQSELDELNSLLDRESATERDYDAFIDKTNLDLAKITEQTAKEYADRFLSDNDEDIKIKAGDKNE